MNLDASGARPNPAPRTPASRHKNQAPHPAQEHPRGSNLPGIAPRACRHFSVSLSNSRFSPRNDAHQIVGLAARYRACICGLNLVVGLSKKIRRITGLRLIAERLERFYGCQLTGYLDIAPCAIRPVAARRISSNAQYCRHRFIERLLAADHQIGVLAARQHVTAAPSAIR